MSDLTTKHKVQENIKLAADRLWALAQLDGKTNSKFIEYTEVNQFILYSTNSNKEGKNKLSYGGMQAQPQWMGK